MILQAVAKQVELWLIDKLIPFARNPRTHSDAQIAQIAASIAEFGFNNPILVDTNAGIIAGHGRLLAAAKIAAQRSTGDCPGSPHRKTEARLRHR